ncbi:MAG: hypothetical protein GKR89_04330 [Candidatus Latescibacteria bacterium]|nr:hypothetical protein [Candidatus Latescibacterota bacterium]
MAVITIARQIGSGGDWIAEETARELDYRFFDRRLVEDIAQLTDTTPEEVEQFDEKGEGRVQFFLKRLLIPEMSPGVFPLSAAYFPEFGLEFPYALDREEQSAAFLDRGTYQLLITTLVQDYGNQGRAVIVGRASQIILSQHPQALHIKIVSPFEERCQTLMEARQVDEEQAAKLVEQHDRWRQLYLENHHQADWDDPLLYHLTINTGKIDRQAAVDSIVDCARRLEA